ncbi:MAG: hypothetical protein AAF493_13380 [Pseudomonadota bacterium]
MRGLRTITIIAISGLSLSGCLAGGATNSRPDTQSAVAIPGYTYGGEKYAQVDVRLSESAKADIRRDGRLGRLNLDTAIVTVLKARELYDRRARGTVLVTINSVRIAERADVLTRGTNPGPDELVGDVRLVQAGVELARFPVTAQYGVGILRKWTSSRLEGLTRRFATMTGNRIGGKKPSLFQ